MATTDRGVVYIVWGDKVEPTLQRSLASVKRHHPELPIHIERVSVETPAPGLREKSRMGAITPFPSTLYLDADTVVMSRLDYAFEQAERFDLAMSICECPWTRRYGPAQGDRVEYNTGVIFFAAKARPIFDRWAAIAPSTPSHSKWTTADGRVRGLEYDDQASFAKALELEGRHPYALPINFNYRPDFQRGFFAPLKVWHDYRDPAPMLETISQQCDQGQRLVTWIEFSR